MIFDFKPKFIDIFCSRLYIFAIAYSLVIGLRIFTYSIVCVSIFKFFLYLHDMSCIRFRNTLGEAGDFSHVAINRKVATLKNFTRRDGQILI